MMAVSPQVSPPPSRAFRSLSDLPVRRLFVDDEEDEDDALPLPSVFELLQEVVQLQIAAEQLGPHGVKDESGFLDGVGDSSARGRLSSVHALGPRPGLRNRVSSFNSDLNSSFSSDLGAPPPRSSTRMSATPGTRVAALTKENISLLRAPLEHRRSANFAGSVCGSQQSRTSVRTDGGAVFSRLYQPDFYKTRDQKLKSIRDRQESLNFSFIPRTNNRSSVCSRDSAASSSVGSMYSAKTEVLNVSSRLYDPDYMRKRTAKLQKMREERELRSCTFAPATNGPGSVRRTSAPPTRK